MFAAPSDDDGHHAGQQSRVAQGETSNSPRGSTNSGTMMAVSTTDATKGAVILEVAPVDRPRPHASQRCARPMPREPEFAREPELEHEPRWRAVSGSWRVFGVTATSRPGRATARPEAHGSYKL